MHATRALGKSSPPGRELFERYRLLGIGSEKLRRTIVVPGKTPCSSGENSCNALYIWSYYCVFTHSRTNGLATVSCRGRVCRPIRGTERTGSSSALNKLPFKWFDLPFSLTINQGRGLVFPRMLQEMLVQLRDTAGPASPMPSQQCHAAGPVFLDLGCVGLTST